MHIPLDNLYHWIEGNLPQSAMLYLFYPHGNKNISGLTALKNYQSTEFHLPQIICHDQEPLDYNLYQNLNIKKINQERVISGFSFNKQYTQCFDLLEQEFSQLNLRYPIQAHNFRNFYDNTILIHSEKNSNQLEQYKNNGYIGVHYWSHAVIARDWYRFAEIDHRLHTKCNPKNTFLIYCRDWSHRREYRLKFLELLCQSGLHQQCITSVMKINSQGVSINDHVFSNSEFDLTELDQLDSLSTNNVSADTSGYYQAEDFCNSKFSVILETEFDGDRIHLTEKTLRAIACGHPFLLAAGPGSLEYLKSYGFKTFDSVIDESYDKETNSLKRLQLLVAAMSQVAGLTQDQIDQCNAIAEYNRKHFFSAEFFAAVESELRVNLEQAFDQVYHTRGQWWRQARTKLKQFNPRLDDILYDTGSRRRLTLLRKLQTDATSLITVPSHPGSGGSC